ncbi:MAG TPA: hypothetical protein VEC94_01745 [Pseudolabrys sp.]|nr:hypothetical protein [Pseudolabrys sp.]
MCHPAHIHVMLSAEDKKDVKKLAGVMIPVYATVMLALVAFVAVAGGTRQGELVATTAAPAATR